MTDTSTWETLSEAIAFVGNSLLGTVNQTSDIGLDSAFWDEFPDFGDKAVKDAVSRCRDFAECGYADEGYVVDGQDLSTSVSVEQTKLFIGPPKPAAAPWETFYVSENVRAGHGDPTFEMQRLLADAGLEMSGKMNQYADHIGIELLYLSVLCEKAAKGEFGDFDSMKAFIEKHPKAWIGKLFEMVNKAYPDGYVSRMLALGETLLSYAEMLAAR